jgi:phage terminase Nu1 subunit (DNA packaging protein)
MPRARKIKPEHLLGTQSEAAENAGVTEQAISNLVRRTAYGYEGPASAVDFVRQTQESLGAATLRKEIALADKHETDSRRMRGELVDRAAELLLWAEIGQTLRDQMLGLPDRVAAECAALTDARMVRDYLLKEIKIVLKNLPEKLDGHAHAA